MTETTNTYTPIFRGSYPVLFSPKKMSKKAKDDDLWYSITGLFEYGRKDPVFKEMKRVALEALIAEFGPKEQWPPKINLPFRLQEERGKFNKETQQVELPPGHVEGNVFMIFKGRHKPGVVDEHANDVRDPSKIYGGCYLQATVRPYTYDTEGNKGVAFGLQNVQFVRDGESFGNRVKAQAEFKPLDGATGGGDTSDEAVDSLDDVM